jgi:Cof subfamily protein (haloacid dehalogenase superfamily)
LQTLYVSDLDRTLLDDQGRLRPPSRRLLCALLEKGVAFTVASARSIHSIVPILGDLPLRLPLIEFNGSFLSNLRTASHELVNAMDADAVGNVMATAARLGLAPCVSSFDGVRDNLYCPEPTNDGLRFYVEDRRLQGDPRLRPGHDGSAHRDEQVVCLTFIDSPEPLEVLNRAIGASQPALSTHLYENWYSPGWWWLTVHSAEASKASAVEILKGLYGLQGRRTVVFGDQVNDLSMMKAADHAVAVSNAVAEVRQAADEVIGDNNSDAVARYIAECEGLRP